EEILLRFQRACFCGVAVVFIMSAVGLTPAFAQATRPAVATPSKWVNPVRSDGKLNLDPADPSVSLRWVLIDRQINAKNDEQFFHWVRQVVNPDGVRRGSHIVIAYDPSYESLTMHWVKILRGTNILNGLEPSRIQTNQSGLDTADFLFTAQTPVTLLLNDVRPGDFIDYAYSIDGSNPVLDGMFTDRVPLQYEEPVEHLVTRLLWPTPRKFYVQNHGTDIYPTTA